MARRWLVTLGGVFVVAALAVAAAGAVTTVDAAQADDAAPSDVRTVSVGAEDDRLWPYTSRDETFETRTLPITLVVRGDPETVRSRLGQRTDVPWEPVNETGEPSNVTVEVNQTTVGIGLTPAHGSMRYTYVRHDGEGQWLSQRYQLHAGTYLGTRSHVRAYAPAGSEWTALQPHSEYWDWFRLRHTVTDVRDTSRTLATDFATQPLVVNVDRSEPTPETGQPGGLTVVHVAGVTLLGLAVPTVRRRLDDVRAGVGDRVRYHRRVDPAPAALFAFAFGVPIAVRATGLALEALLSGVHPQVIAAPLYVLLVVGLPVGVYRLGTGLPVARAFILAAMGFLVGVGVEFVALGVGDVPPRIVWQRVVLAAGLGGLAGGVRGSRFRTWLFLAGCGAWWGTAVAVLFGVV